MTSLQITDTLAAAKEIAFESGRLDTDEAILRHSLDLMNGLLMDRQENARAILSAAETYVVPDDELDVFILEEQQIRDSRIENAIVRGRIHSFMWFGSVTITGFGLRVYGVDFHRPEELGHVGTAFMPLDTIDAVLAA